MNFPLLPLCFVQVSIKANGQNVARGCGRCQREEMAASIGGHLAFCDVNAPAGKLQTSSGKWRRAVLVGRRQAIKTLYT